MPCTGGYVQTVYERLGHAEVVKVDLSADAEVRGGAAGSTGLAGFRDVALDQEYQEIMVLWT
jgi:hypothetical protein